MIDIEIEDDAWDEALPAAHALARRAAEAALAAAGRTPQTPPEFGLVAILLTDDEAVADLLDGGARRGGGQAGEGDGTGGQGEHSGAGATLHDASKVKK